MMMTAADDHSFSFTTSADSSFAPLVEASPSDASKRRVKGHKVGNAASMKGEQNLEKAVFAHIRAMRTLGRTSLNTLEVARALSLPVDTVDRVVAKMSTKGVRVTR